MDNFQVYMINFFMAFKMKKKKKFFHLKLYYNVNNQYYEILYNSRVLIWKGECILV